MTTWKLWRGLNRPSYHHRLYQYALEQFTPVNLYPNATRPVGLALLGLVIACALFPATMLGMFMVLMLVVALFTVFNGTIYGVRWAVMIGEAIVREKELGTYELLSLLPVGSLGTRWLMAAGCLHRKRGLQRNHQLLAAVLAVALITLAMIVAVELMSLNLERARTVANNNVFQMLLTLISIAVVIAAIYVDHIQSVVLSGLVGMLTPSYTQQRLDARVWAAGIFLLLQFGTYVLAWLLGMLVLPAVFDLLGIRGAYVEVGLSISRLAIFYGLREAVIVIGWRTLIAQLNADARESDVLVRALAV